MDFTTLKLGEITMDVVLKDIKNIHLSVYPPIGRVRISAPRRMSLDTLRLFAISKLDWIKQQQAKLRQQEREAAARLSWTAESHYLWGKRYLLQVIEADGAPSIELRHSWLLLRVRQQTGAVTRKALVEEWYRERLKAAVPPLLARWQPLLGVRVERFFVQRMKTKWEAATTGPRTLHGFKAELAKKPAECLEYLVVHELVHLLEPTHNAHFIALMDRFMHQWQFHRHVLNRLPVRQERWTY